VARHPGQAIDVVDEAVERRGGHLADIFHGLSVADKGSVRATEPANRNSCDPPNVDSVRVQRHALEYRWFEWTNPKPSTPRTATSISRIK
jgi:hypothetical protein